MYLHTEAGDKHEKECGTCQSERASGSNSRHGPVSGQPASHCVAAAADDDDASVCVACVVLCYCKSNKDILVVRIRF